jgi:hypothetical protein
MERRSGQIRQIHPLIRVQGENGGDPPEEVRIIRGRQQPISVNLSIWGS